MGSVKVSDDNITGDFRQKVPGTRILTAPVRDAGSFAMATLYIDVHNSPDGGVIRVDLEAESSNQIFQVGGAFVTPGFAGIPIVVTGVVADSWHVVASATSSALRISRATLMIKDCCASFSLAIPPGLQDWPADAAGFPKDDPRALLLLAAPLTPMGT